MGALPPALIGILVFLPACNREVPPEPAAGADATAVAETSVTAPADEGRAPVSPGEPPPAVAPHADEVTPSPPPSEEMDESPLSSPVGRAGPLLRPCEAFALDAAWAAKPQWDGREVVSHSEDWREVIVRTGPDSRRLNTPLRFHWDPTWGYQLVEEEDWERSTSVE
jgi:hypothetical protein